jgi:hypothetical protein
VSGIVTINVVVVVAITVAPFLVTVVSVAVALVAFGIAFAAMVGMINVWVVATPVCDPITVFPIAHVRSWVNTSEALVKVAVICSPTSTVALSNTTVEPRGINGRSQV